jgi:hypothetical protein
VISDRRAAINNAADAPVGLRIAATSTLAASFGCHFENYLAAFFERYLAQPAPTAYDVVSRPSEFLSANHAVRFGGLSPDLPDISR